jgi:stage II sporulation protein R
MKKIFSSTISLIILICVCICIVCMSGFKFGSTAESSETDLASRLIRFHVIANSDSPEDQALKLKVRDAVLEYISPKLKDSKSIDESREIIKDNDGSIKKIAADTINTNNYKYNVTTSLSNEYFPVKSYGNITLPQGKYEAYRIIIGTGNGKNWWCVMFPPLCFVDIAVDDTSFKKIDGEMKKYLTSDEYAMVCADKKDIKVKFKVVEIIKKLMVNLKK